MRSVSTRWKRVADELFEYSNSTLQNAISSRSDDAVQFLLFKKGIDPISVGAGEVFLRIYKNPSLLKQFMEKFSVDPNQFLDHAIEFVWNTKGTSVMDVLTECEGFSWDKVDVVGVVATESATRCNFELLKWMKAKGLTNGNVIERYITDYWCTERMKNELIS
eukprot:TRINITY_DN8213_c0_g1_i1.p1 TRINITY_DN8213_c0_g1~~TRINITY_DN8213_c0_g1_i1.p1  ORF type:complete len:163 (-),score=41.82 TRINITY_DN8213_c0_g1_i1:29-517(-)